MELANRDLLGKYNDVDFSNRGVFLDYNKDGKLEIDSEVQTNNSK